MIGNLKGSSTVESVIIVPLIFLLVFGMLLLLLNTYDYSRQVLNHHEEILNEEFPEAIQMTFKILKYELPISYEYQQLIINSRDLQQVVEYIIYLMETYYKALKGLTYDQEQ
ncbi:MAG: pilus assembly protein [Clostridiales bacterium]|nr:pilus assembly protein [Clostridiales bacterium]